MCRSVVNVGWGDERWTVEKIIYLSFSVYHSTFLVHSHYPVGLLSATVMADICPAKTHSESMLILSWCT